MSRANPPEHIAFLKANGHNLGALTGTDFRALAAIAALWHLYAYSRKANVIGAVNLALVEMQASTRVFARPLIAHAMDWSDVDDIWPSNEDAPRQPARLRS
jgi:hypothetical protein